MDQFDINEYHLSSVEEIDKAAVLKYIKTVYCMNFSIRNYSVSCDQTYYYAIEFNIDKENFSFTNIDLIKLPEVCDISYIDAEFFIRKNFVSFKVLLRKLVKFDISTKINIIQEEKYKESTNSIEPILTDPYYTKGLEKTQEIVQRESDISGFYANRREKDLNTAEGVILKIKKSNIVETCELDDDPFHFFIVIINFKKGIFLSGSIIHDLLEDFMYMFKGYKVELIDGQSFRLYVTMEKQNGYEFSSTIITKIHVEIYSINRDTQEMKTHEFIDTKSKSDKILPEGKHNNGSYIRKKFKSEGL